MGTKRSKLVFSSKKQWNNFLCRIIIVRKLQRDLGWGAKEVQNYKIFFYSSSDCLVARLPESSSDFCVSRKTWNTKDYLVSQQHPLQCSNQSKTASFSVANTCKECLSSLRQSSSAEHMLSAKCCYASIFENHCLSNLSLPICNYDLISLVPDYVAFSLPILNTFVSCLNIILYFLAGQYQYCHTAGAKDQVLLDTSWITPDKWQ